jgi:Ca2+-binding RTX toxin-like protein
MFSFLFGTTSWNYLFTTTNFTGSFRNDIVFSSFRNDIISTGDGNDYVDSGAGNDVLDLGRGNDTAFGGSGNDTIDAGEGDDYVDGGSGNDIIRAGSGNDIVFGGSGNDTIIYRADATSGNDRVNGGQGFDSLVLELTAAQQASAGFIADRAAFNSYLAAGGNGTFQFQSIGLTVTGGFEQLRIDTVGGVAVNTAPVVSGPVTLPASSEDATITITAAQLLANSSDAEGNTLTVFNVQASSGTIINNGNGTFTYTPDANANGTVSFTYIVSDGALSTAATATLAITAVNDGPVAGAAVVLPALAEDTFATITAAQLLANASDVDGDTLTVRNLVASSGTVINNGNGMWTFAPDFNDNTAVTFTYQISDGVASVASSASLDLTAVNDGPVAGAAIVLPASAEDTAVTITSAQLLANASDVDGDTLTVQNLVASSGALTSNGDGTWSFTPAENDNTAVTFTYEISDGVASVASSASLDLTAVNDGPVAGAAIVLPASAEDTAVTITSAQLLANASDVDGDALSVQNLTASSGTLTSNGDGTWSFTPAENDNTAVTFTYQISDGVASVASSASLDLTAVNDGPVAGAAIVLPASAEDTAVTITSAQLLANASDVDGDALTVQNLVASSGALTSNGDGTWSFTPGANDDTNVTFTYQISDGELAVAGSASLDLTPVNDAPVNAGTVVLQEIAEDTSVILTQADLLAGTTDVDSPALSISNVVASSGTVLRNDDGTWTFTPDSNDDTAVIFTYQVSDGEFTVAASASIDLTPVNDRPLSGGIVLLPSIVENTSTTITADDLLINAADVDSGTLTIQNLVASSGTLIANENGTWTFTPDANDNTSVTFTFEICDGELSVATSALLDLRSANSAPVIDGLAELPAANEDTTFIFTAAQLLANVSDPDGDALTIVSVESFDGTLIANGDGTWTYTPENNNDGIVEFLYLVSDGQGGLAFGTAVVDLIPVNDAPVIGEDSDLNVTILRGGTAFGSIIARDIDSPQNFTYEINYDGGSAPLGSVILNEFGNYRYDPPIYETDFSTFVGQDSFEVIVTDSDGGSTVVTVTINVEIDPNQVNFVFGNGNDEGQPLVGTIARDVFRFENFSEDGVFSGVDVIQNFTTGQDIIQLVGDPITVNTSEPNTDLNGNFVYAIGFGSTITSSVALTAADFQFNFYGTSGDDVLTGGISDDELYGLKGNDTLNGGAGSDYLSGGEGDDTVIGEDGNDTLFGEEGDDNLNAGAGDDYLAGNDGDDIVVGGSGSDVLVGGVGNDTLTGGLDADRFEFIVSQTGDDKILDFLSGGDTIVISGDVDEDVTEQFVASGIENPDGTFTYNIGPDTSFTVNTALTVDDIELQFSSERVSVVGTEGGDSNLNGTIFGDILQGLNGNDTISGFSGNDLLIGGQGDDVLTGGTGFDAFEFNELGIGNDIITDFDPLFDRVFAESFFSQEAFLASVVDNDGSFTYTLNGGTVTTNVQLDATNTFIFILPS